METKFANCSHWTMKGATLCLEAVHVEMIGGPSRKVRQLPSAKGKMELTEVLVMEAAASLTRVQLLKQQT